MNKISFSNTLARHTRVFSEAHKYSDEATRIFEMVAECITRGGKLLLIGNGGSAADCQHLAAEFMVRYKSERPPLAAIALTTDTSILTAHSNDYDFSTVFERQIVALGRPEDLVIALTTSGNSKNVNLALSKAREMNIPTVVLTGRDGGEAAKLADLSLVVTDSETARIQELHMFIGHWLCESIDDLFSGVK